MAGMLPGVESARRRRIHGGGGAADQASSSSRRPSFCLYATGHDQIHLSSASSFTTNSSSSSTSMKRSILNKEIHDGALGDVAREAKQRLDAKLMVIRSTGSMKTGAGGGGGGGEEQRTMMMLGNVQREVFSHSSRKSLKKFNWSKLGWKASEQAECVVCLEEFKAGEVLAHLLPCAHRFHWNCAAPWLESRSQCPCCRTSIFSK